MLHNIFTLDFNETFSAYVLFDINLKIWEKRNGIENVKNRTLLNKAQDDGRAAEDGYLLSCNVFLF